MNVSILSVGMSAPSTSEWLNKPIPILTDIQTPSFRIVHKQTQIPTQHAAATNGLPAASSSSVSLSSSSSSAPSIPLTSSRGRVIKLKLRPGEEEGETSVTLNPLTPAKRKASDHTDANATLSYPLADGSGESVEEEDMSDMGMLMRHSRCLHQLKREYVFNCFPAHDHQVCTREGFMFLHQIQQRLHTLPSSTAFAVPPSHSPHHHVQSPSQQHQLSSPKPFVEIACYVDGRLEYHPITAADLIVHTGSHRLVELESSTDNISLCPTDNHRMYGRMHSHTDTSDWSIHHAGDILDASVESSSLAFQLNSTFEHGAKLSNSASHSDDFLRLYAFCILFGQLDSTQTILSLTTQHPSIAFELHQLLQRSLPTLDWTAALESPVAFVIHSQSIIELMSNSPSSSITWHTLSTSQIRLVLQTMLRIQSLICTIAPSAQSQQQLLISSSSRRDQLLQMCMHAGYSAYFTLASSSLTDQTLVEQTWCVHFTDDSSLTQPTLPVAKHFRELHHDGTVWCVSVPTESQLIAFRRVSVNDAGEITQTSRPLIVGNTLKRHRTLKRAVSTPRTPSLSATPKTPKGGSHRSSSQAMKMMRDSSITANSTGGPSSSANADSQLMSPQASPVPKDIAAMDWPSAKEKDTSMGPPSMSRQISLEPFSLTPSARGVSGDTAKHSNSNSADEDVLMQPLDSVASGANAGEQKSQESAMSSSVSAKEKDPNAMQTDETKESHPCPSPTDGVTDPYGLGLTNMYDVSCSVLPLPTSWSLQSAGIDPSSMYYLRAWVKPDLQPSQIPQPKFNYEWNAKPWKLPKKYILCNTPPLDQHARALAALHASAATGGNIITLPKEAFSSLKDTSMSEASKDKGEKIKQEFENEFAGSKKLKKEHISESDLKGDKKKKSSSTTPPAVPTQITNLKNEALSKDKKQLTAVQSISKAQAALDAELKEKQKLLAYLQVRCQYLKTMQSQQNHADKDHDTKHHTHESKSHKDHGDKAGHAVGAGESGDGAPVQALMSPTLSSVPASIPLIIKLEKGDKSDKGDKKDKSDLTKTEKEKKPRVKKEKDPSDKKDKEKKDGDKDASKSATADGTPTGSTPGSSGEGDSKEKSGDAKEKKPRVSKPKVKKEKTDKDKKDGKDATAAGASKDGTNNMLMPGFTSSVLPGSTTSSLLTGSSSTSGSSTTAALTTPAIPDLSALFPLASMAMPPFQYDAAQLSQLASMDVNTMMLMAQAQLQFSLMNPALLGLSGMMFPPFTNPMMLPGAGAGTAGMGIDSASAALLSAGLMPHLLAGMPGLTVPNATKAFSVTPATASSVSSSSSSSASSSSSGSSGSSSSGTQSSVNAPSSTSSTSTSAAATTSASSASVSASSTIAASSSGSSSSSSSSASNSSSSASTSTSVSASATASASTSSSSSAASSGTTPSTTTKNA